MAWWSPSGWQRCHEFANVRHRSGRRRVWPAMIEDRMTVRITEAELARDVRGVLAKVEGGDEAIIEREDHRPVAVMKQPRRVGRKISECIALAKAHEEKLGQASTLEPDFAADVEEIIHNRKAWNPPEWD